MSCRVRELVAHRALPGRVARRSKSLVVPWLAFPASSSCRGLVLRAAVLASSSCRGLAPFEWSSRQAPLAGALCLEWPSRQAPLAGALSSLLEYFVLEWLEG